jgi:hypothetical protein
VPLAGLTSACRVRVRRIGRTVVHELVDETAHEVLHRIGAGHAPSVRQHGVM